MSPAELFPAASILRVSTVDIKRGYQEELENLMTFGKHFEGKGLFLTKLDVGSNKINVNWFTGDFVKQSSSYKFYIHKWLKYIKWYKRA